jgi:peptidoglycan/xylan/chitin deacetylase (PgdA/CDA1 family)
MKNILNNTRNKFCLSTDDYGFLLPGDEEILRIKQHYPNFKITCFTIPLPNEFFIEENAKRFSFERYKKWAEIVNSYDWMEIAIHGFAHTKHEADCGYDNFDEMMRANENLFKKVGLKYSKIFKAPYWQISYDALHWLKDNNWIVAIDRNNPRFAPNGIKKYVYNWSVEEKQLPQEDIIKGHSHTTERGVNNALGRCYKNITNVIPEGADFYFVSEVAAMENANYGEKKTKS